MGGHSLDDKRWRLWGDMDDAGTNEGDIEGRVCERLGLVPAEGSLPCCWACCWDMWT